MFKPRKLVGWIRGRRGYVRVGGGLSKILYNGVEQKRGEGNKYFRRGGQARSRDGCHKKGGAGTHLQTMSCNVSYFFIFLCFDINFVKVLNI